MTSTSPIMTTLKGIPGSPGIVFGKVHLVDRKVIVIPRESIPRTSLDIEVDRFYKAVEDSKKQLKEIKARIDRVEGKEHIFIIDTHLMIMQDEVVLEDVAVTIRNERINAEWALKKVFERLKRVFDNIDDEYLRERKNDLDHIARRILQNLMDVHQESPLEVDEDVVLVAHDLSPYDMAHIDREKIHGIATDIGGGTSHLSILARAMEIPSVVGLESITAEVKSGDTIILDGITGTVHANPTSVVAEDYQRRKRRYEKEGAELRELVDIEPVTKDGHKVVLAANVELAEEIPSMQNHGIQTIGLFRSEYLYLVSHKLPTEDQNYELYKEILEKTAPHPATIRTLDVGGDKFLSQFDIPREANPALGLRAIRFCFKQTDLFKSQLRALVAASPYGNLRIMFPMISGLEEVLKAKEVLAEVTNELKTKGEEVTSNIEVGIMIEVPSAAMIADVLAKEVDFFSIGTNDLIQYSLAIDRINEHVSYLYQPLHPALLRMIKYVTEAGHAEGIDVGICGEMASEPLYLPLLLGLGLDELSMNAISALKVKKILLNSNLSDSKELTAKAMKMQTPRQVTRFLIGEMKDRYPEDFEDYIMPPLAGPFR